MPPWYCIVLMDANPLKQGIKVILVHSVSVGAISWCSFHSCFFFFAGFPSTSLIPHFRRTGSADFKTFPVQSLNSGEESESVAEILYINSFDLLIRADVLHVTSAWLRRPESAKRRKGREAQTRDVQWESNVSSPCSLRIKGHSEKKH